MRVLGFEEVVWRDCWGNFGLREDDIEGLETSEEVLGSATFGGWGRVQYLRRMWVAGQRHWGTLRYCTPRDCPGLPELCWLSDYVSFRLMLLSDLC